MIISKIRNTIAMILWVLTILVAMTACENKQAVEYDSDSVVEREQRRSLVYEYAKFRSLQLNNIHYTLNMDVSKQDQFSGDISIEFELNEKNRSPITIDFDSGDIHQISINGTPASWRYDKWFIVLSPEQFSHGKNIIAIEFSRPYSQDGDGLYQYRDADSNEIYLYSNFEPYNANRMFPHFDQPNLKATYRLQVKAPKDWQVITSTRETAVIEEEQYKQWQFPESPLMSSYVFSLHAGPFHVWSDTYNEIELRLFARQEIKDYVKTDDWFMPTKKSLAFFNQYFDLSYPFKKYDQIIVPDFNSGAMENIAAVTFSELYVSRSEKTERMRRRLASTIAHELAHQWFGDLVTMDWWNGLWLNESFATYMSYLQMQESGEFPLVWDDFFHRMKLWAYQEDQLVTSHPIELEVPTSTDAFSNFDGITYGKGASVLRQLSFLVGEENFRQGVIAYLKQHAYANAKLSDFINAIAMQSNKNIEEWKDEWLLNAGLNTLEANYSCKDEALESLNVIQSSPVNFPILRTQNIQIALYSRSNELQEEFSSYRVFNTEFSGKTTAIDVENAGIRCPSLVFINYGDHAYVKAHFDPNSFEVLQSSINQFSDISVRTGVWHASWQAVMDAELSIVNYLDLVVNNIAAERHLPLVRMVGVNTKSALDYLMMMQLGERFLNKRSELNDFFWTQFVAADAKSDMKRVYLDLVIESAFLDKHLQRMRHLLNLSSEQVGMKLDHDLRWQIIARLNRYQYGDYQELLSLEQKKDRSDRAQKSALVSEAERADPRVKQLWLATLIDGDINIKFSHKNAVMKRLFKGDQRRLLKPYSASVLANLSRVSARENTRFLKAFTKNIAPALCEVGSVRALEDAIHMYQDLNPVMIKELKIVHQNDQRCLAMRKKLDYTIAN